MSDDHEARMTQAMNARRFPTTQKLLTDALFRRSYRRFRVALENAEGQRMQATVWARSAEEITALYLARGMARVETERLPIAPWVGQQFPDGTVVGDVIVIDEAGAGDCDAD